MKLTFELINEVIDEADKVMKSIFPTEYKRPMFTTIKISKAESYWMQISYNKLTKDYKLRVSTMFEHYTDDSIARIRLTNSMIHELIHTLPGCMNHGPQFKRHCYIVNSKTIYNIETTTEPGEGFVAAEKVKKVKYVVKCPHCGKEYIYQRKCRVVDYPFKYRCSICGHVDLEVYKLL